MKNFVSGITDCNHVLLKLLSLQGSDGAEDIVCMDDVEKMPDGQLFKEPDRRTNRRIEGIYLTGTQLRSGKKAFCYELWVHSMLPDSFFAITFLGEVMFCFSVSVSFNDVAPPIRIFECMMICFVCDRSQRVFCCE